MAGILTIANTPVVASGGGSYTPPVPTPVITSQARTQIISYVSTSLKSLSLTLTQQGTPTPAQMQIIQQLIQVLMQLLKLVS